MPFVGPIHRYAFTPDGAMSRQVGAILPATAEVDHIYPYQSDRLWFVQLGESIFAVMAQTSDDAWSQIWSLDRTYTAPRSILGIPEYIGREIPRTDSGQYLGISRAPATETSVVICPHGKVEVYCSICDEEARAILRRPVLVKG